VAIIIYMSNFQKDLGSKVYYFHYCLFFFLLWEIRGFGYVTYSTEEDAERAARVFNGFNFNGNTIKTKGPRALREEGHSPRMSKSSQQDNLDYRPYTDCSFFMQGNLCKKGENVSWSVCFEAVWSYTYIY